MHKRNSISNFQTDILNSFLCYFWYLTTFYRDFLAFFSVLRLDIHQKNKIWNFYPNVVNFNLRDFWKFCDFYFFFSSIHCEFFLFSFLPNIVTSSLLSIKFIQTSYSNFRMFRDFLAICYKILHISKRNPVSISYLNIVFFFLSFQWILFEIHAAILIFRDFLLWFSELSYNSD